MRTSLCAQVPGAWAGSGAPILFSTRDTREPGKGWYAVQAHVRALAGAHMRHMMVYGAGNDRRLTGRDKCVHQTVHPPSFFLPPFLYMLLCFGVRCQR